MNRSSYSTETNFHMQPNQNERGKSFKIKLKLISISSIYKEKKSIDC